MSRIAQLAGIDEDVRARVSFLAASHDLTRVERRCRVLDGSRPETTAEHSWHLGLCALVLAPEVAPGVDVGRVLSMLAIHDLVEIDVGDVPAHDERRRLAIAPLEREAAVRMFASFPEGAGLLELWQEFDAAETDEARFAHAIDRLQPLLVHWAGGGLVWRRCAEPRERLDRFVGIIEARWPPLGPLAAAIVADAARLGDLRDEPRATPG